MALSIEKGARQPGDRRMTSRKPKKKRRGSGAVRMTLSSQEGAQTTRRARKDQNGAEHAGEGAGLPRESQATKGIVNGKESGSNQEG